MRGAQRSPGPKPRVPGGRDGKLGHQQGYDGRFKRAGGAPLRHHPARDGAHLLQVVGGTGGDLLHPVDELLAAQGWWVCEERERDERSGVMRVWCDKAQQQREKGVPREKRV